MLKSTCCEEKKGDSYKKGVFQGILYGLIPHTFCILFILASIFGATFLINFLKPFLMNQYFFYILILISLILATISSLFYLRKNKLLSLFGIKRKWKYLLLMYGLTIGINLLFFMVIFPYLANVPSLSSKNIFPESAVKENIITQIRLKVNIPCPGHGPLIINELKTIDGVEEVQFTPPDIFDVKYNSNKATIKEILALEVFKTYKASVL